MSAFTLQMLRPRERRLALAAAVVIGCWLFVSWIVQPLLERGRELRLRVETQTEKLEALRRLLVKAPAIEQEYQQLAGYVDGSDDPTAQGTFLSELESLSRETGVTLNLKPRPAKTEGRVSRFEVELDIEGPQDHLLTFLDELLRMPKLIAIDRLRISIVPAREGQLRANLVLQKLSPLP